jgi:cytochrome P450
MLRHIRSGAGSAIAKRGVIGMNTLDIDPYSTEFLSDPYAFHAQLRDAGAAVLLPQYNVVGLARYADVRAALEDPETFCSGRGVGLSDFQLEAPWRPPSIILEADAPMHTRTRAVLNKALSKAALASLADSFDQRADQLVRELLARGTIDGIRDLAETYPLSVFPDAVGVVEEGRGNLLPYGDMAFNAFGPRNKLFERSFENAQKVSAWIIAQCERENLTQGGIGASIYAAVDAGEINEEEAGLLVRSILTAGLDTTIFGIGGALYCFAENPDQWEMLRAEPRLTRSAFTEVIRYLSPAQTFYRTTTRAVDVDGVHIDAGQKVLLFLAAANRDPRHWDEPDSFDITRRATGHVGFGHGLHVCVGQQLARMEGEAVLKALAKHVTTIRLDGTPTKRVNNTLYGFDALPLVLS